MVRLDLCMESLHYNVDHYAYSNPISSEQSTTSQPARIQKLETQVTDLRKMVADQEKRLEEMEESNPKKAIEDLTKRIEELESWPGTSEDALMKMRLLGRKCFYNDAEGNPSTKGPPDPAGEAGPSTEG
ncbi:hypothetical protein EAF00_009785 [Botryotinia globosa]|nr:hypothetical protein EAF00_009785 [Botryotinia globosa]